MNALAKKDYRWLCVVAKGYNLLVQFPLDFDKSEAIEAMDAGLARPIAIKDITGPMDKQHWMDMTPSPIAKDISYGYTMLFKNPAVWHKTVTDEQILKWYAEERKKFPVNQVKVSGSQHEILEHNGKFFIKLTKKCESCGLVIHGTCMVSKKPDGSPGNVQMFVPDEGYKGAMPSKPKSKLWLCKEHAVTDITSSVKEEYKPSGVTIPAPRKHPKAVITAKEYASLKIHVRELVDVIKELKEEMKGLISIKELETIMWELVGRVPHEEAGIIAKFIKSLKQ